MPWIKVFKLNTKFRDIIIIAWYLLKWGGEGRVQSCAMFQSLYLNAILKLL